MFRRGHRAHPVAPKQANRTPPSSSTASGCLRHLVPVSFGERLEDNAEPRNARRIRAASVARRSNQNSQSEPTSSDDVALDLAGSTVNRRDPRIEGALHRMGHVGGKVHTTLVQRSKGGSVITERLDP